MYAIDITAAAFRGQSILKQQRMVNAALGDLVKTWHGVQIRTKVPPEDACSLRFLGEIQLQDGVDVGHGAYDTERQVYRSGVLV
ncbi:hypothetical protein G7046_g9735 [Stylonectria norvegica]|nr:hypothetical protein G7046_g9735 [Stylonectria norvegica]